MAEVGSSHLRAPEPRAERIREIIEPAIEAMGFELVRVIILGPSGGGRGKRAQTLQVMADRADGTMITVDDCAEISRTISAVLDVEDPIPDEYSLEVSSPGIDRPLTRLQDFERFAGFDARIELVEAVEGRKRFKGVLGGIEDEQWVLMTLDEGGQDGETVSFNFEGIEKAKLVLTDALIAASQELYSGAAEAAGTDEEEEKSHGHG